MSAQPLTYEQIWGVPEVMEQKNETEKGYQCGCGKDGMVDLGELAANRFPCWECFEQIKIERKKQVPADPELVDEGA